MADRLHHNAFHALTFSLSHRSRHTQCAVCLEEDRGEGKPVETARKTVLPHNLRLCSQINLSVGPATVKAAILSRRNQGSPYPAAAALERGFNSGRAPLISAEFAGHIADEFRERQSKGKRSEQANR